MDKGAASALVTHVLIGETQAYRLHIPCVPKRVCVTEAQRIRIVSTVRGIVMGDAPDLTNDTYLLYLYAAIAKV